MSWTGYERNWGVCWGGRRPSESTRNGERRARRIRMKDTRMGYEEEKGENINSKSSHKIPVNSRVSIFLQRESSPPSIFRIQSFLAVELVYIVLLGRWDFEGVKSKGTFYDSGCWSVLIIWLIQVMKESRALNSTRRNTKVEEAFLDQCLVPSGIHGSCTVVNEAGRSANCAKASWETSAL